VADDINASDIFTPASRPMPAAVKAARLVLAGEAPDDELGETDTALAAMFAFDHADQLQYDHRRQAWMVCTSSGLWHQDASGEARRLLQSWTEQRAFDRVAEATTRRDMQAVRLHCRKALSARGQSNLLTLACHQAPVATAGDDWDANTWALATSAGQYIDLRTGGVRPLSPGDRITRAAGVAIDPAARCDRFRRFLVEICDDDAELVKLLTAALGYSLTGAIVEQVFFLCMGSGSNGKTLLLEIVAWVLGDLAGVLPFGVLTRDRDTRAVQAEIADLPGARFVRASEVREGVHFDEGRIKSLTGGDPVNAARKFGHPFSFRPQFKLWLATNARPRVSDRSHGFWRRARLIPFARTFPGDKTLEAQLRDEAPGILAMLVDACLQWQAHGLPAHAGAELAREAWREAEDVIAQWADTALVADPAGRLGAAEAFRAFTAWATAEGLHDRERPGRRTFGEWMTQRFAAATTNKGKFYAATLVVSDGCGESSGKVFPTRAREDTFHSDPPHPPPTTAAEPDDEVPRGRF
jgi:putative DNA primase/helicase